MSESKVAFQKWFADNIGYFDQHELTRGEVAGEAYQAGCHYVMDMVESRKTSKQAVEQRADNIRSLKFPSDEELHSFIISRTFLCYDDVAYAVRDYIACKLQASA